MANEVEIANIALQLIGEQQITSFADDTPSARNVRLRFSTARDTVLRDHPWNFAKRRARLARLNEKPDFGWDNQFKLPSDLLRVLMVSTGDSFGLHSGLQDQYVIEGDRLLTNGDEVFLIYVARVTNTEEWDALATEALVAYLAAELAIVISDDRQFAAQLRSDYQEKVQRARSADAQEEPSQIMAADRWVASRFGSFPLLHLDSRDIDTSGN